MDLVTKQPQVDKLEAPYDIISLPSEGLLYPNKLNQLKMQFVTADDENILTSAELMKSGEMIDVLVKKKVTGLEESGLSFDDLLVGDMQAIRMALRRNAYGDIYSKTVKTPSGRKEIFDIDLTKLNYKCIYEDSIPDENGEFNLILQVSKDPIKFKLLTSSDEKYIRSRAASTTTKDGVKPYLTTRLERMIMEIGGNRDRIFIANYVKNMRSLDSLYLRKYVDIIEPGIDTTYEYVTKDGEEVFTERVFIDFDFWYPTLSL